MTAVRRPKPGMFQPERLKDTLTMMWIPVAVLSIAYLVLRLAGLL